MEHSPDLSRPRAIEGPQGIPLLARGRDGAMLPVGLLRTRGADEWELRGAGAFRTRDGWYRHREEPFPFEDLEPFLPRMARRTLVPEIVDLIPATSWFASLANMLTPTSWQALRAPLVRRQGGCEDCGARMGLEAHEAWAYDDEEGVQTLEGILVLCRPCHETRHLGFARSRGVFAPVFRRLAAVNRLRPEEESAYLALVEGKWASRSEVEWQLRLPLPAGMRVELAPGIVHAGDGWLLGRTRSGEVSTRVCDVGVDETSDGVWLVGLTPEQLAEAQAGADAGWGEDADCLDDGSETLSGPDDFVPPMDDDGLDYGDDHDVPVEELTDYGDRRI